MLSYYLCLWNFLEDKIYWPIIMHCCTECEQSLLIPIAFAIIDSENRLMDTLHEEVDGIYRRGSALSVCF